ncbi:Uncharacterized [Syntrophomonas zehnderi OL-4]|uniref:Uncharacterized n=1 Tax=Syntrophomonas zehnderi OL-4 TaxID=690567 RepID=A0A0E4GCU5_9FIRM|nr:hypothetical protein [Syntrophomonas zehnderi]CFX91432.1 Uncharacterized [Syntrophomonas zehnderi OL-4]
MPLKFYMMEEVPPSTLLLILALVAVIDGFTEVQMIEVLRGQELESYKLFC